MKNKTDQSYWQVCPLCEGTNYLEYKRYMRPDELEKEGPDCPVCKGQRIISTATGKPPMKEEK